MLDATDLVFTASEDKDGCYYVTPKDVSQNFKRGKSLVFQLEALGPNLKLAKENFQTFVDAQGIELVEDTALEDIDTVVKRSLRRGDLVSCYIRTPEGTTQTYLVVIDDENPIMSQTVSCYDPWFNKHVDLKAKALKLMSKRERKAEYNHPKYGVVIGEDFMFEHATKVLAHG